MQKKPQVLNYYKIGKVIPDGAVSIARPSKWGNPFIVSDEIPRGVAVEMYRTWVYTQPWLLKAIREELRGKDLVCTCAPLACHGDVQLKIANE